MVRSSLQAEEDAADVDHLILNEEGDCLQVNPTWLQYLQVTHCIYGMVASQNIGSVHLSTWNEALEHLQARSPGTPLH